MKRRFDQYQTFWLRVGAQSVDGVLLLPFSTGLTIAVKRNGGIPLGTYLLLFSISMVVTVGYEIILPAKYGQTLGKMATGVKIVRTDGMMISYQEAFLRYLPNILLMIIGMISMFIIFSRVKIVTSEALRSLPLWPGSLIASWILADFITFACSNKHRALHDFIAETEVVRLDVPDTRRTMIAVFACVSLIAVFVAMFNSATRTTHNFSESVRRASEYEGDWSRLQDFNKLKGRLPLDEQEFADAYPTVTQVIYLHPATTNAAEVVLVSKEAGPSGSRLGVTQSGEIVQLKAATVAAILSTNSVPFAR